MELDDYLRADKTLDEAMDIILEIQKAETSPGMREGYDKVMEGIATAKIILAHLRDVENI